MPSGLLDTVFVSALAGLSLLCVFAGVHSLGGELRLLRRLDEIHAATSARRALIRLLNEAGKLLIGGEKDRQEIEQNLRIAGYYGHSAPLVFGWARLGCTLGAWLAAAAAVSLLHKWSGPGQWAPWAAAGVAYLGSKRMLRWRAGRRRRKVEAELPFVLDVLCMMLESGVSLDQSLRTIAQTDGRAAPLVKDALTALAADIERGMPYETALDRWAERLGVGGARELASLFKRNLAHGAELSGGLKAFAREFTDKRVNGAREAVGRKSAQMAVVMMIFFMPALFIVLAGPAFVTLMNALKGVGG